MRNHILTRTITLAAILGAAGAVTPRSAQAQDCLACEDCTTEDMQPGHRTFNRAPTLSEYGVEDEVHGCLAEGPCSAPTDVTICKEPGQSLASIQAMTRAADRQDGAKLAMLVKGAGRSVEVNVGRGALQVMGCNGTVVAHIPLSAAQLATLARTRQNEVVAAWATD